VSYELGIDIGTSYTAGAVCRDDGLIEVAGLGPIVDSIPTVLYLAEEDVLLVGDAANRRAVIDQAVPAREFKRLIGRTDEVWLSGNSYSPVALMARMLCHVRDRTAEHEGQFPDHISVTHPANWGAGKLELLDDALRAAGMADATTLAEPSAAALAYAAESRVPVGATLVVYDLGGGTFDTAVLRKQGDDFELLGESMGIERLGGADLDELVLEHVRELVNREWPDEDPAATIPLLHLRRACTEAKELLSSEERVIIPVLLPGIDTDVELTRTQFEVLVTPLAASTLDLLGAAIESAGLTPDDLDTILLVGGTSRIPLVGRLLEQRFGSIVGTDVDPLFAVAKGAAISASIEATSRRGTAPATTSRSPRPDMGWRGAAHRPVGAPPVSAVGPDPRVVGEIQ